MKSIMAGELGPRLKEMRQRKAWTVRALSARSGVSVGYISGIENGAKRNPGLVKLQRLADALGLPLRELLPSQG